MKIRIFLTAVLATIALLLAACGDPEVVVVVATPTPAPVPAATSTPQPAPTPITTPTSTAQPQPTSTPEPQPTATTSSSAAATGPFNLLVAGCDDDRLEIPSSVRQALAGLGFTQCSTPFGILLAAAADMPGPVVTYAAKIVAEFMDQDQDGYADHAELSAMLKYPGGVDDQRAWLAMPTKHGYNEGAGRDHMGTIGYEIEIPAWWIWGDAGRNGDFSAGLDDHAKAVIWEEIDHFVHQFGLSHVFPGEFGVQSWDSLLAQETKRAAWRVC